MEEKQKDRLSGLVVGLGFLLSETLVPGVVFVLGLYFLRTEFLVAALLLFPLAFALDYLLVYKDKANLRFSVPSFYPLVHNAIIAATLLTHPLTKLQLVAVTFSFVLVNTVLVYLIKVVAFEKDEIEVECAWLLAISGFGLLGLGVALYRGLTVIAIVMLVTILLILPHIPSGGFEEET